MNQHLPYILHLVLFSKNDFLKKNIIAYNYLLLANFYQIVDIYQILHIIANNILNTLGSHLHTCISRRLAII